MYSYHEKPEIQFGLHVGKGEKEKKNNHKYHLFLLIKLQNIKQ